MATSSLIPESTALIAQILQKSEAVQEVTSPAGTLVGRAFKFRTEPVASVLTYSIPERQQIVGQLRLALSQFYVHLERKKAIYGFDPVRALDLLAPSVANISDAEFHESIVQLIARTRDRHLSFTGKAPYGMSAGLGFLIEQCWDGNSQQYVVTRIQTDLSPQRLRVGAIVTHWNGIPIEKYIRLNANVFDGGNEAASFARSLAFLTERPLTSFGPPIEEWVDLRFVLDGVSYEERFPWQGFDASQVSFAPIGRNLTGFGGDLRLVQLQHARRVRFAPKSFDAAPAAPKSAVVALGVPRMIGTAGNAGYGSVTTQYGTFGYIRLWSFAADNPDDIVNAFIPLLAQVPRKGLIIDMRGNTGGRITAGERVLQLFTPKQITPSRFQFRVTPATRAIVGATTDFATWQQSLDEAFASGEPYTQGYPVEGLDSDANKVGQKYFGPVVIITDALAYSTADMFVAGFIDHEIGRVICTDQNMSAAGGNNWSWDAVRLYNFDFSLDPSLKAKLEAGVLSPEIRDAFNQAGSSLSQQAALSAGDPLFGYPTWNIKDGALTHMVLYADDITPPLNAYLARSHTGISAMPAGIGLGLTMRRCVRVGKNEGKLLEDLGIKPDVLYHMTLRDIMQNNQDLITRASLELSQMPAYDLDLKVRRTADGYALSCTTSGLASVQVYAQDRYLAGSDASDDKPSDIAVSGRFDSLVVKGFRDGQVVARSLVSAPAQTT